MPEADVQKLFYTNDGAYTCYPKVTKSSGSDKKWVGHDFGQKWEMDGTGASLEVDLIKDCGFQEGDEVIPGSYNVGCSDASPDKTFRVVSNNKRADFTCRGTAFNPSISYNGVKG